MKQYIPFNTVEGSSSWRLSEKIVFRFFFSYFLLYIFPFPLSQIPFGPFISNLSRSFYEWLVPLVAQNVFSIVHQLPLPGGSGDTTFSYIEVFIQLCAAVVITVLWSVLDRKRNHYQRLFAVLLVLLRYFVGSMMLVYGLQKIFVNQFADLSLFDMVKTYGESSPMGLLWNFMEYSASYSIFTGLAEFIGGLLLLFRRTTKLGALIIFAVMLNVFMLNMSYDVPVKLFSLHLVLMTIFILMPYFGQLINFFVKNTATVPRRIGPYFASRKWNVASYVVKGVFLVYIIFIFTTNAMSGREKWGKDSPLPPLYGIYETTHFIINNDTLAPLTTDTVRWDKLVIDKFQTGIVKMNGNLQYMQSETDTVNHSIELISYDSVANYKLQYEVMKDTLLLKGTYNSDEVQMKFLRKDRENYPLIQREFNWINEYPNNR